jgi:hypothetical protein
VTRGGDLRRTAVVECRPAHRAAKFRALSASAPDLGPVSWARDRGVAALGRLAFRERGGARKCGARGGEDSYGEHGADDQ